MGPTNKRHVLPLAKGAGRSLDGIAREASSVPAWHRCATPGSFLHTSSTRQRFSATRTAILLPNSARHIQKMPTIARHQRRTGLGLVEVSVGLALALGCSALDEARPPTAMPRVNLAAKSNSALPTDRPPLVLTATEKPNSVATSNVRRTEPAPRSMDPAPEGSPLDLGLERSYLLPYGDTSAHGKALASKYANLQPGACRAEVRRRRISAVPARGSAQGISSPMRIVGPLRSVRFVTPGPKSVHGILDCRLVLLLDELSQVLAENGVAVVYVDGFYRPKAHLAGRKTPSQHAFGLAIDIHGLGTKDGRTLVIERDFAGRIGTPVCGEAALLEPSSREAAELRNIVCAMARARAFHYLLTPNYDAAHGNHLHGDIKRGGKQLVVR